MSFDYSKHLRFGTTRSRNGCLYCRARRVKCDEKKPTCGRCQARSTACNWPTTTLKRLACDKASPESPLAMLPGMRASDSGAFEYFVIRTSRQLVGTWKASTWIATLVQVAMVEPAIQQAGIALGTLHRIYESGQGSQQHALVQYGKALQMVRDNMIKLSDCLESLILACLLFCAFECMSYHIDSAMSHLSSGLSLVLQRALSENSRAPRNTSMPFLLSQMRLLDNDRMCLGAASLLALEDPAFDIPKSFSSLHEAQELLGQILNLDLRQLAAVAEGMIPADFVLSLEKTNAWSNAFDTWLAQHCETLTDEDVANVLPVLMWRTMIALIINADFTKGEMAWDSMLPEFEHVVDCAERFMDLTAELVPTEESWKHPSAYVTEPANKRAQQTLTVHQGGKITEGLLAKLLASVSATSPTERIGTTAGIKRQSVENPNSMLIDRAQSISNRKDVTWSSSQSGRGAFRVKSTYTVSHGIVYPLFAIIVRCRHPSTRRRGLHILEDCNRHEGLWDSRLAAMSAKRFIMVEESEAANHLRNETISVGSSGTANVNKITGASQIPNHCRVRATGKVFLPNGRVLERFCLGWKRSLQEALHSGEKERWIELDVVPT